MKIRIGYVAQNLSMGITPSHTITVRNFMKIPTKDEQIQKLVEIGRSNLQATLSILQWNVQHHILVYRLSSKLIPLATWQGIHWDYLSLLKPELEQVGDYIKKYQIRVSAHPDHFSVLNTPNPSIFQATIRELQYHHDFLEAMGLDDNYKLVVHVGGVYGDKWIRKKEFCGKLSDFTTRNPKKNYIRK